MKKIITKNKVILSISNNAELVPNGIKVDDAVIAISVDNDGNFTEEIPKIEEVANIPEYLRPIKYCYSEETGFYHNPDFYDERSRVERLEGAIMELTTILAIVTGGEQ